MSETWPTNATLKREHDQLLADHRETMVRLRNVRDDLNGTSARLVEVDNQLQATVDEMRALRAEFRRLAGETEADKPSPAVSTRAEQANPVTVEAAELAVTHTGLANSAHFVQYAVRTPDRIQVYGDQSWVKHGTAAAGHPDGGADTVVRDIWVSYDPWRTYEAGETGAGKPAPASPAVQFLSSPDYSSGYDQAKRDVAANLLGRIKRIEEPDGSWPGSEVVDVLTAWFTDLGIDIEGDPA